MNHTPLANLTLEELVTHVCNKAEPTDEELELLQRIEGLQDKIEDLENDLYGATERVEALEEAL